MSKALQDVRRCLTLTRYLAGERLRVAAEDPEEAACSTEATVAHGWLAPAPMRRPTGV
jgi:hypothetical protein